MIQLLKRLLPPLEALPPNAHFHLDEQGNEVLCDEYACRPTRYREPALLTPLR